MYTWPRSSGILSSASWTGRAHSSWSSPTRRFSESRCRCCTTRTDMGKSAGRALSTLRSACSPPQDVPITTRSYSRVCSAQRGSGQQGPRAHASSAATTGWGGPPLALGSAVGDRGRRSSPNLPVELLAWQQLLIAILVLGELQRLLAAQAEDPERHQTLVEQAV